MDQDGSFDATQSAVKAALIATTRNVTQLASEDLAFHRSLDPSVGTALDRQNTRLLSVADRILAAASDKSHSSHRPRLDDISSVDDDWRTIVDAIDSLLERADTALDEFTGAVRRLSPGAEQAGSKTKRATKRSIGNQSIEKPQLKFDHVPTNSETGSFKPLLSEKPHSVIPLESNASDYAHPYQSEIEQYSYPNSIYTHAEPTPYHPFESTTAILVDTEEAVDDMLTELKKAKEIAIDLEHHDQRSYIGIVCLMQISTRDQDWIVDTLKPWRRKLQCLNQVFADPRILKVLHGAYMDAMWLQRDLGLYLVGLFDTHFASRALGYTSGSLAFLLKKFANVDAQKQYQTADWRIRPLPEELFDYARSDTHYLLYIFDHLRNELIQKSNFAKPNHEGDKIWDVMQKSAEVALQRYEHPVYDANLGQGPNGWYKILARSTVSFSKEQFSVFRAVHQWRDNVARQQDDSTNYVMPNHQIFSIARSLPINKNDLYSAAQPITQSVRWRIDELLGVIEEAKLGGEHGPEMMDILNVVEPQLPRPSNQFSVAAHAAQLHTPVQAPPKHVSSLPLRTETSAFWGSAFDNSSHKIPTLPSNSIELSLAVPLPPLASEIFADSAVTAPVTPVAHAANPLTAENTPVVSRDDDTFVLKETKKRKRKEDSAVDGVAEQTDVVNLEEDGTWQGKVSRAEVDKAAKKLAKEAKKARKQAAAAAKASEEVFDYEKAPSLLNPPAETRQQMKERKKKEKNPYLKSLDAPKGLPRVQKERAGRSKTFKS